MARIRYVATCHDPGGGSLGILLDIHLCNGQTLLLSLKAKEHDRDFQRLYQAGELQNPKTDGSSIYWCDGPQLSFSEIMELVREV